MKIKRKDLEQIEKALQDALLARRNNEDDLWALNGDVTKAVRDALMITENALDGVDEDPKPPKPAKYVYSRSELAQKWTNHIELLKGYDTGFYRGCRAARKNTLRDLLKKNVEQNS